jgi:hypothetical protein
LFSLLFCFYSLPFLHRHHLRAMKPAFQQSFLNNFFSSPFHFALPYLYLPPSCLQLEMLSSSYILSLFTHP